MLHGLHSNQIAGNLAEINEQLIKTHNGEKSNFKPLDGWLVIDNKEYIPFKPYYKETMIRENKRV